MTTTSTLLRHLLARPGWEDVTLDALLAAAGKPA